jgi:4-hydroxy-2-oxoheptanedioate aldolase
VDVARDGPRGGRDPKSVSNGGLKEVGEPQGIPISRILAESRTGNTPIHHLEEIEVSTTPLTGAEFKEQLRAGTPKVGLFVNSHSTTIAEQLAHSGYDWLLIDTQHGPMSGETLSAMLCAVASGGAKSMVRVAGFHDRGGIQQALDLGADGVLVPYINSADEARQAVSCARYPTSGTRSVYFPQRSTNKAGLLGYVGNANKNVIVALQVETAACIEHITEIAAVPGVDILFLGQNDLCMSMGLYEKYEFPHMYTSPELNEATQSLMDAARGNNVILGVFLFGTARVGEFLDKGFTFVSVGNDLHHVLTQAGTCVKEIEEIAAGKRKAWSRAATSLV